MGNTSSKGSGFAFWFFTLITVAGVCILLQNRYALQPVGKEDPAQNGGRITVSLSDSKATELVERYLTEEIPVKDVKLTFSQGNLSLAGTAMVEDLLQAAVPETYPEIVMLRRLLPKEVDCSATFSMNCAENGLQILPVAFSVGGHKVPVGFLPTELKKSIGDALRQQVDKTGLRVTAIRLTPGMLYLECE